MSHAMKRTAKDGVKQGKNRAGNKKVAPAGAMMNEKNTPTNGFAGEKPSHTTAKRLDKEQDITEKKIANGRLPPLVPPVKKLPQKNSGIELDERKNVKKANKLFDTPEVESAKLPILDETPSRACSPATRRRDANMTNYERMLQREKNRGRKISSGTNYNILQSETEDQDCQSVDGSTLVVEDETQINGSNASLLSRSSAKHDPNHALLQYFAKLSSSADVDDLLDLERVQSLLREGASVNTCDRFGQTLLHEVSKTWGTDVAQFFIDQGKYIS